MIPCLPGELFLAFPDYRKQTSFSAWPTAMIYIHCIFHRLALTCSDTNDEYKVIQNVEKYLIELRKCFKNSPKRLRIYINVALKSRNFEGLLLKELKKVVKRMTNRVY